MLTKVQTGDADAGLVYRTDVLAAGDTVEGVKFPEARVGGEHLPDRRPRRDEPTVAQAFVDLVLSDRGAADPGGPRVHRAVTPRARRRRPRAALAPAALAVGLLVLPVVALLVRARLGLAARRHHLAVGPADALWLSLSTSVVATARVPGARRAARRRARPRRAAGPPTCCAPWSRCRSSCRRRSAASRCSTCWAGAGWSGRRSTRGSASASRSRRRPWSSPRRSSRCRSWSCRVEGSLRTAGTRLEVVAASLGAGRWTVLRRITLPLVDARPGQRHGPVLRAGARRVRRDRAVRRQLPGRHADHAAGHLLGVQRSRRDAGDRGRAVAAARVRGGRGPARRARLAPGACRDDVAARRGRASAAAPSRST